MPGRKCSAADVLTVSCSHCLIMQVFRGYVTHTHTHDRDYRGHIHAKVSLGYFQSHRDDDTLTTEGNASYSAANANVLTRA